MGNLLRKSALTAALFFGAVSTASAGVVTVWGEALSGFSQSTINNFYNGLTGHSSSIAGGTLDTVDLSTTDLLWATQPGDDYTGAELSAMATFLLGGGRIAFMGEHGGFAPAQNTRINTALAFLGSDISTVNNAVSCGFQEVTRADGEILNHSLTTGVDNYEYACYSELLIGGTAEALMYGDGMVGTSIMMAYQNIGPGSVFFITDQNVWDNAPNWGGNFGNARMFENLLEADTGAPPTNNVPEPATSLLFGLGLLGVCWGRRRRAL